MNLGKIDYANANPPRGYACTTCRRHGCKLWREYQTFADTTELICCDCAGKSQKEDVRQIDTDGMRPSSLGRTDAIGLRIPAVPTEDGTNFWGYTSVPPDGCAWWRSLPTRV
jgi:hypothetical protein